MKISPKEFMRKQRECNHGSIILHQIRNNTGHIQEYPIAQCQCCGKSVELSQWFQPVWDLYLKH